MATLKELMGDLKRGDGRIISNKGWSERHDFEPIYWAEGFWYGLDREGSSVEYDEELNIHFYEFKKTKIIKMYKPIKLHGVNDAEEKQYYSNNFEYHSDKSYFVDDSIAGWLEIECEVED